MANHLHILHEIEKIQGFLIEKGYVTQQNFVKANSIGNDSFDIEIALGDKIFLSDANDCLSYEDLYFFYQQKKIYVCELIDGALIQMEYCVKNGNLWSYRLGFFPHPHLIAQEFSPELYNSDDLFFVDMINKPVIHPVLRFDFDNNINNFQPTVHSRSHLTVGQLDSCRIAVNKPLTPFQFIDFIFKHFYSSFYIQISKELLSQCKHHQLDFKECIEPEEKLALHIFFE